MIDDFVKPPSRERGDKPQKSDNEDFFPDLSAHQPNIDKAANDTPEPSFVTPEDAAAHDEDDMVDETIDLGEEDNIPLASPGNLPDKKPNKNPHKARWWTRFNTWFKNLSKKKKALFVIAVLLLLVVVEAGIYTLISGRSPIEHVASAPKKKPAVTTVASNLTGLPVAPEINERPVTAVMIENSVDARPQAGLSEAGVVFEAIAEGGITRFLALYQDTTPESLGPIRSARPYYIDWLLGFDATYAHVGGSPEAQQQVKNDSVKDLDQMFNAGAYQRVSNRYMPHNVFTSMTKLHELAQSKGYGKSTFTSFPRKKEKAATQPTASTINLAISSARFNVQYAYDAATNSYLRTLGGQPHADEKTSKQIAPKVVIAMVMNYGIASDGKHSTYNTIGNGQVYVFQDGMVSQGTWEKTAKNQQITFTDSAGKPITLNPGQTWITAINSPASATYQP